jgi:hypothetical protein
MKKSFLNKFKTPSTLETERKLLPRLKFMGYVMYGWSVWALCFALMDVTETATLTYESYSIPSVGGIAIDQSDTLPEINPKDVLNFYAISAIFAVVGTACIWIERMKRKKLLR